MQAENRGRCTEENRLSVYKSCFETEFLTETELFYQLEKGNYLVNHSTLDYVRKVSGIYLGPRRTVRPSIHLGHTTLPARETATSVIPT